MIDLSIPEAEALAAVWSAGPGVLRWTKRPNIGPLRALLVDYRETPPDAPCDPDDPESPLLRDVLIEANAEMIATTGYTSDDVLDMVATRTDPTTQLSTPLTVVELAGVFAAAVQCTLRTDGDAGNRLRVETGTEVFLLSQGDG